MVETSATNWLGDATAKSQHYDVIIYYIVYS